MHIASTVELRKHKTSHTTTHINSDSTGYTYTSHLNIRVVYGFKKVTFAQDTSRVIY